MILKTLGRILAIAIIQSASAQNASAGAFDRALELALKNQTTQALAILNELDTKKQIAADLLHLTRARIYFQTEKLDAALEEYNQIPERSAFWLTSIDEKAQALGRKGRYADVIATLQTAMAPMFADRVSPEIYFTAALTNLKICDYATVFKVTEKFKTQMKPRIDTLQTEVASNKPNLQLHGRNGLKEIDGVINKLQVIEAEVIERISLTKKNDNRLEQGQIASGSDVMKFKVNDEVWLDELGKYQAQVKECPTLNVSGKKITKKRASI